MSNRIIELSRYLSLILRHKPEVIGITLDDHGWANVEEVIAGINKTRFFDMSTLEEIVATDDKQRYSFNEDKTLIRANQGHSIPVDVELEEAIPPDFLYHGTGVKYLDSIKKIGLIPKSRLYVHLSDNLMTAFNVGLRHGEPVVLGIDTAIMIKNGYKFYRSANGVWLTKEISPRYIEVL